MVMVFDATFNNISNISCMAVNFMGGKPESLKKTRPDASHCQFLSHNVVLSTPRLSVIRTRNDSGDAH